MVAENRQPGPDEIAKRAEQIYSERLKSILEPAHLGEYVVIDVDSGEYEVDRDHRAASDRAAAKHPHSPRFAMRVGSRTLGRIGAGARTDWT